MEEGGWGVGGGMRESERGRERQRQTDRQTDRDRELLSQDSCSGYQGDERVRKTKNSSSAIKTITTKEPKKTCQKIKE